MARGSDRLEEAAMEYGRTKALVELREFVARKVGDSLTIDVTHALKGVIDEIDARLK